MVGAISSVTTYSNWTYNLKSASSVKNNARDYQNPFKDIDNISGSENYASGLLVGASGKFVKLLNKVQSTIDLPGLSTGMYILNLTNKSGEKTSVKLIKN